MALRSVFKRLIPQPFRAVLVFLNFNLLMISCKTKTPFVVIGISLMALGASQATRGFAADAAPATPPQKIDPAQIEFFETKIRPVLAENCYSCHNDKKQKGALRVDSKVLLLKGGDSGPALIEKDPDKSLLIKAVKHKGDIQMPPGKKLKDEEVANLETWVRMGAPWPNDVPKAVTSTAENGFVISDEVRKFWSFQPVRNYAPPKVKNGGWAANPIDNFILARLEARGLAPNKPADKTTLIRRATYDLHGLPPTPQEMDEFVADKSPEAYEKVIDRLLASPRYGESWGRHWLDVARYADTKGYVFNEDRNYYNAFQYRDWVIRAFNEDLPYDQFITLQLAADRLDLGEDRRGLAALGFLRVGRRFLNQQPDIIDDRIDTTMRGFQGLTVACARCHDHKFDPVPTQDYYSLYGVFASSTEPADTPISPRTISEPWQAHDKKVRETDAAEDNLIQAQVKILRERQKNGEKLAEDVEKTLAKFKESKLPRDDQLPKVEVAFEEPAREKLKALRTELETLKKSYPPQPELAMTMADADKPVDQRVFKRGNRGNQGEPAPRRYLAILAHGERPEWKNGSGRLELAKTIASKDNPLTARVMVNRMWMQHFGAGLVRTPSDFGTRGELPTHPELLDYLARRFMDGDWSIKKMHKLMMMSSAYRQGNDFNEKAFAADPENLLLWRMNRRRLELEALRDSLVFTSGKMDSKVGGPAVDLWKAPYPVRRAVYGQIERQNLPGIFKTFDFATPDATSPQRFKTTVPQQALFLMNDEFVVDQARQLASRPEMTSQKDDASRIRVLYQMLFARVPSANEIALGQKYLQRASAVKPPEPVAQNWLYGYGGFDEKANRVTFNPLKAFKDGSYRFGNEFPDPKAGYATLSDGGGHPGREDGFSVIRRWTAPQDGVISITGTGKHPNNQGDGVDLRIVSSRDGSLGNWTAFNNTVQTEVKTVTVKKDDTLDFVASRRTSDSFDSFEWQVSLTMDKGSSWSSQAQFGPPQRGKTVTPLSAWTLYTQALLMSNEFYFVD